jgi:hypothetical protein
MDAVFVQPAIFSKRQTNPDWCRDVGPICFRVLYSSYACSIPLLLSWLPNHRLLFLCACIVTGISFVGKTMSVVNITEVNVLDNPALFTAPYRFDITFESLADLSEGK